MDYLIIGKNGQLGKELGHLFDENNISYKATTSKELDITNSEEVTSYFEKNLPKVIFDCAAYTDVEGAEDEMGKAKNNEVNVNGTKNIAIAASKIGATVVYISSDYVFDGKSDNEYSENDVTNPINNYGKAKLEGEKAIENYCNKYYIIRTSWLYGQYGSNFVYTMLDLSKNHDELKVVNDQIGRPTWTKTLAEFMYYVVKNSSPYGIYQLSNEGKATWYEFAKYILKDKDIKIIPVNSDEFVQKAERPKHSVMSLDKVKSTGFENISWKKAIDEFLKN